jgi:hypothetical protein
MGAKMINFSIKNFYSGLKKPYKASLWLVGAGILGSGVYFSGAVDYIANLFYNPAKSSIKTRAQNKQVKKQATSKKAVQVPRFKIIRKGDFDHNRIDDIVLQSSKGTKEYYSGWYNQKTHKPQYLPYDVLRNRLQRNSPNDVRRYDNLVSKILRK